MTGLDTFVAAISIVTGIVAIGLSIFFFVMSNRAAHDAERASLNIAASVQKLETLFDKLYSGTFDMMKETVTDLRQHVYGNSGLPSVKPEDVAKQIEEKTNLAVSQALEKIRTEPRSEQNTEVAIREAIAQAKMAEEKARSGVVREVILEYLTAHKKTTYTEIENQLRAFATPRELFLELVQMYRESVIDAPIKDVGGGRWEVSPALPIRLSVKKPGQ